MRAGCFRRMVRGRWSRWPRLQGCRAWHGGSATTDGGRGLLEGLADGGRRTDATDVEVACDVSNPLLGPTGAAATYGPQKGASPGDVIALDARNAAWADELEATEGRRERDTPGAGA